tara:strand:- start:490 stop:1158 length:669 start_codon:yes stop_codon:yes gene_type:complete
MLLARDYFNPVSLVKGYHMILFMDPGQILDRSIARFVSCPWTAHTGSVGNCDVQHKDTSVTPLYTPEERRRRDETPWTLVQGILAPLQFLVFLVSLWFVANFMLTGAGYEIATATVVGKTLVLYAIMVTGMIWERAVFGQYLFAKSFFWEDFVSMFVIAAHTIYILAVFTQFLTPGQEMVIALVAYTLYVINAAQFLIKLRAARLNITSKTGPFAMDTTPAG